MDVYIKSMEMPTRCYTCPCADLEFYDCNLMPGTRIEQHKRLDDCPLVPVQPHGRLIDADALDIYRREEQAWHDYKLNPDNEYLEGVKDGLHEAAKQLSTAPTIIPAEEGER